jgi:hypothetical protein
VRLAALLLVASCHVERAKPPSPVPGPPELAWKQMTHAQRADYMDAVVVPKMKPLFQELDPKLFADFGCKTCHGKGVDNEKFDMPNPDLFVLPGTPAGMMPIVKTKGRWVEVMTKRIKPTMAGLLGLQKFDPEHAQPDAFGCQSCHVVDQH